MRLFVSIGRHYEGYTRKSVTPYMHILVFHVPQMIQKYGNIKKFSGQGELQMVMQLYFCGFVSTRSGKEQRPG